MEEITFVIKNKDYGYFVSEEYVPCSGEIPNFSNDINNAMLFGNLTDCLKYECYGKPIKIVIKEVI